jgi:hypothetical protein
LNPSETSDETESSTSGTIISTSTAVKPNESFMGGVNSVDDVGAAFDELFN